LSCESAITGTVHLLGHRLQVARDLGDLVGAVFLGARYLHQLQVVDHDQRQAMLALEPAGARAQLGRRQAAGVVDEQLGAGQQA
jgi:hypothetical protein